MEHITLTTFDKRLRQSARLWQTIFVLVSVVTLALLAAILYLEYICRFAPLPIVKREDLGAHSVMFAVRVDAQTITPLPGGPDTRHHSFLLTLEDGTALVMIYPNGEPAALPSSPSHSFSFKGHLQPMTQARQDEYRDMLAKGGLGDAALRLSLYMLDGQPNPTELSALFFLLPFVVLLLYIGSTLGQQRQAEAALAHYGDACHMKAALDAELPDGTAFGNFVFTQSFLYAAWGELFLVPYSHVVWAYVASTDPFSLTPGGQKLHRLHVCASDGRSADLKLTEGDITAAMTLIRARSGGQALSGYRKDWKERWLRDSAAFVADWRAGEIASLGTDNDPVGPIDRLV